MFLSMIDEVPVRLFNCQVDFILPIVASAIFVSNGASVGMVLKPFSVTHIPSGADR